MELGLAFVTLGLVSVTLLVSVYFGLRTLRLGVRSADASERAADASEEELGMLKAETGAKEARQRPLVDLKLLQIWPSSRRATGHDVMMRIVVENRSSEPDVLRRLTVELEGERFTVPSRPGDKNLKAYTTVGVPQNLTPGKPIEFRVGFPTDPFVPAEGEDTTGILVAECTNAGEVNTPMVLYPAD